jgi:ribonuclease-3
MDTIMISKENPNELLIRKSGGKKDLFTKVDLSFIKYLQTVKINRKEIENLTGFRIHDLSLYQTAFVHKSVSQLVDLLQKYEHTHKLINDIKFPGYMKSSYERLEFLGDSVYNMALSSYIYERFPTQPEGFLSRLNALIKSKSTLSLFSRKLELDKYILMIKPSHLNPNEFIYSNNIMEDVFESFIASIFLDNGGFNGNGCKYVSYFIKKCIETFIDNDDDYNDPVTNFDKFTGPKKGLKNFMLNNENYKDILQRHCQAVYNTIPSYKLIDESGFGNSIKFKICVYINDSVIPNCESIGKTKKDAEQKAAMKALNELNVEDSRDADYFDETPL